MSRQNSRYSSFDVLDSSKGRSLLVAALTDLNPIRVQELDSDGHAVTTAFKAPEKTVMWHGALAARALLEDRNLTLVPSVVLYLNDSEVFFYIASQVTKNGDMSLAQL